jgi:F0F1-type ATP synthase delta subunit
MSFFWPETKFARENSIADQIEHVFSEVEEIKRALKAPDINIMDIDMEIFDLHHSVETFIRLLQRFESPEYVQHLREIVINKNRERGYYKVEGVIDGKTQ